MKRNKANITVCRIVLACGLCGLLIILASCAIRKDYQSLMKQVTARDNSFNAGFIDGCDSGLSTNEEIEGRMYFQDMIRYKSDSDYASGWDSGYNKCSR